MTAPVSVAPPSGAGAASLSIALWGNFQPGLDPGLARRTGGPWSTETHVALTLESLGHTVTRLQEGTVRAADVAEAAASVGADLFVWISTHGLAVSGGTLEERFGAVERLREMGIPTLSFHLDKWWDVRDGREDRITRFQPDPFFRTDLFATADEGGGRWQAAGVNAVYSPPGVYHAEAVPGMPRRQFRSPVAFVGSWRGGYHPEWRHRAELIAHLQRRWGRQCAFWPRTEQIRGRALNDLYASVRVVVGDSFSPPGSKHYSDRVPESLGRGGTAVLLHPRVPGLDEDYTDGQHLRTWEIGDWETLDGLIDHYVTHPDEARALAVAGQDHVQEHHTYQHRMARLIPLALEAGTKAGVPA